MRDKYNLNTLPPSLQGLEEYEMDDHIAIPGMGGMNEDRQEYNEQQMHDPATANNQTNVHHTASGGSNALIPGLDLDVSSVRDRKPPRSMAKNSQLSSNAESNGDASYGITAHDPASILTCVREIVSKMVHRLPGIIPLSDLKPEKIQILGKEIEVQRE